MEVSRQLTMRRRALRTRHVAIKSGCHQTGVGVVARLVQMLYAVLMVTHVVPPELLAMTEVQAGES